MVAFQMVGNHHASTTPKIKEIWNKLRYTANITISKEFLEREREKEGWTEKFLTQFFSRSKIWSILQRKSFPLGGVISSNFFTRSSHDFISSFWNQQVNVVKANVNMLSIINTYIHILRCQRWYTILKYICENSTKSRMLMYTKDKTYFPDK